MLKFNSYRPFITLNGTTVYPEWRTVRALELLQTAAPSDVTCDALCHALRTPRSKHMQVYMCRLRNILRPHGISIYTRYDAGGRNVSYYMERIK
jgi:hypothetical protein